jgi:hypothetical protein
MTDDELQEAHHLVAQLNDGLKMARLAVYGVGRKPFCAGTDTETLAANLGDLGSYVDRLNDIFDKWEGEQPEPPEEAPAENAQHLTRARLLYDLAVQWNVDLRLLLTMEAGAKATAALKGEAQPDHEGAPRREAAAARPDLPQDRPCPCDDPCKWALQAIVDIERYGWPPARRRKPKPADGPPAA